MEGGVGWRLGDYTAQTEGSCFIASYIRSTQDSYSGQNTHRSLQGYSFSKRFSANCKNVKSRTEKVHLYTFYCTVCLDWSGKRQHN